MSLSPFFLQRIVFCLSHFFALLCLVHCSSSAGAAATHAQQLQVHEPFSTLVLEQSPFLYFSIVLCWRGMNVVPDSGSLKPHPPTGAGGGRRIRVADGRAGRRARQPRGMEHFKDFHQKMAQATAMIWP